MDFKQIRDHLLPGPERDPRFREYLRRLSYPGLQTVAAVEIAAPVLLQAGRLAVGGEAVHATVIWQAAAMMATGLLTLALFALPWMRRHARLLAGLSAWTAPTLLTWTAVWRSSTSPTADDYALAGLTLVVLTATAIVPFRPWHALALGVAVEGMYIFSGSVAANWGVPIASIHSNAHHVFLGMLTLLAVGISSSNYRHRRDEFEAGQEAVRVAEALTGAQLRAQLAESAISIGKMAAALSHEINSPVGALRSSVETLLVLSDRMAAAPDDQRERLQATREQLRGSIDESISRIDDVAWRLRRFVGLAEAELKPADLNDLVSDVTLLHEDELRAGGIQLDMDLQKPLARMTCRPQLLTAVFSSLLSNAIQAVNGNGHISIETRGHDGSVEVTIRDNGKGMTPEEADTIFDPGFKVSGSRVSSGNWSLFSSRQIIYEHGGDITLETAKGQGTSVHVMLPLGA